MQFEKASFVFLGQFSLPLSLRNSAGGLTAAVTFLVMQIRAGVAEAQPTALVALHICIISAFIFTAMGEHCCTRVLFTTQEPS